MRVFWIFGVRSESGAGSSEFLLDEVRVGQAVRDFCWTKLDWGRLFEILVDEVRVG